MTLGEVLFRMMTFCGGHRPSLAYLMWVYLVGYVLTWLALQVWLAFGRACLRGWSR